MTEDRVARAYRERTIAAVTLAHAMLESEDGNAGVGKDDNETWDDEWRVVLYVDLPSGDQLSWHIAPADQDLLKGLPQYWDGWTGSFMARTGEHLL